MLTPITCLIIPLHDTSAIQFLAEKSMLKNEIRKEMFKMNKIYVS